MADHTWRRQAACLGHPDPDQWTDMRPGHIPVEALRICRGCPVRADCLELALTAPVLDDFGVWGGTTEKGRRDIRVGRSTRAEAMARGDRQSELRTERERLAADEPWLLGESA